MNNTSPDILSFNCTQARKFLMRNDCFANNDMPDYTDFEPLLKTIAKVIGEKKYKECLSRNSPDKLQNVNLVMLTNKDGKYGVRPLSLMNPCLYYFIIRSITDKNNWRLIKKHFKLCTSDHINLCAMPIIPAEIESFPKSTTILNWWNNYEQQTIELSFHYSLMFITDITNCYGSVLLTDIKKALCRKNTAYESNDLEPLSEELITYIKAMQGGSIVGIPQGSVVFDFISEMIMSYSDLLLKEELDRRDIKDYKILRYRDDFRIFSNNHSELRTISYCLQHILESLNFRMNVKKTKITDDLVLGGIKEDKLYYIENTPVANKDGYAFDGFQKFLIFILMLGRRYPNGGQIKVLISKVEERLDGLIDYFKEKGICYIPREKIRRLCAVLAQMAVENQLAAPCILQLAARFLQTLKNDPAEQQLIIGFMVQKIRRIPNCNYLEIWLQAFSQGFARKLSLEPFNNPLCRYYSGETKQIWNFDWLKSAIAEKFAEIDVGKLPHLNDGRVEIRIR